MFEIKIINTFLSWILRRTEAVWFARVMDWRLCMKPRFMSRSTGTSILGHSLAALGETMVVGHVRFDAASSILCFVKLTDSFHFGIWSGYTSESHFHQSMAPRKYFLHRFRSILCWTPVSPSKVDSLQFKSKLMMFYLNQFKSDIVKYTNCSVVQF